MAILVLICKISAVVNKYWALEGTGEPEKIFFWGFDFCWRKYEDITNSELSARRLRIAFHHLESFPRMQYNNQIITKGIWVGLKKKNINNFVLWQAWIGGRPVSSTWTEITDFEMLKAYARERRRNINPCR